MMMTVLVSDDRLMLGAHWHPDARREASSESVLTLLGSLRSSVSLFTHYRLHMARLSWVVLLFDGGRRFVIFRLFVMVVLDLKILAHVDPDLRVYAGWVAEVATLWVRGWGTASCMASSFHLKAHAGLTRLSVDIRNNESENCYSSDCQLFKHL